MDLPDTPLLFENEQSTRNGQTRIKSRSWVNSYRNTHSNSKGHNNEPRSASLVDSGQVVHSIGKDHRIAREGSVSSMLERQRANRTIPERVSQFYYSLGLFCSSHPVNVIIMASIVVILSCLPLLSTPFLGNKPKEYVTSYDSYTVPPTTGTDTDVRWYRGPPAAYVQQVIVKSAIVPWTNDLLLSDTFRAPLSTVFPIVEAIRNLHWDNMSLPFSQFCFAVGEVKSRVLKGKVSMLPEYGCLLVSPADFWQQKYDTFRQDHDILGTILNYQSHQKGRSGLAEILLGMSVRDTGIKRFPLKTRPRIISYAVTLVLQTYDKSYIETLRQELAQKYPTSLNYSNNDTKPEPEEDLNVIHVYFPTQSSIWELIPLVVTYVAMFVYVYFSVKKIDIVTSKLGVAISALATVVASLCMSVGLCSHFGMTFEVNAKAIYPYLVVIIGLENILVLTKSVVSTPKNLDVKIRVAQGLSKEGWSITKNLLTEITILTIGFFTFMPVVQEFCILAIVGLLSDFFLQTFFFATVLSVDIHREKMTPETGRDIRQMYPPLRTPIHPSDSQSLRRVKSNSTFADQNGTLKKSASGISIVAPSHNTPMLVKIPKRLRLIYFWARTRFFQRTFTIFMIGWISIIIYESGIVARFAQEPDDIALPLHQEERMASNVSQLPLSLIQTSNEKHSKPLVFAKGGEKKTQEKSSDLQNNKLLRELSTHNPFVWRRLTPSHWQVLFGVYNFTLTGKYITILPSICISVPIQPKKAIGERHPFEFQHAKRLNWQALANAFNTIDTDSDYEPGPTVTPFGKIKKGLISGDDDPYIPSSPVELALTVLLAIPSIIFIGYLVVVLYRCICSRNYAEWRSSWTKSNEHSHDQYTQVVFEAVPLELNGHPQHVECIGTDGNIIASACLSGSLKVWHANNGENILTVDRQLYFGQFLLGEKDEKNGTVSELDSPMSSPFEENQAVKKGHTRHSSWTFSHGAFQNSERDEQINPNSSPSPQLNGIPIPYSVPKPVNYSPPTTSGGPLPRTGQSPKFCSQDSRKCFAREFGRHRKTTDPLDLDGLENGITAPGSNESLESSYMEEVPAVWCLDCQEEMILLGTGTGRLEVWDARHGVLKCMYEDSNNSGIVHVKVVGNKIVLANLNGCLIFLGLESSCDKQSSSPSPYHRRTTTGDTFCSTSGTASFFLDETDVRCVWLATLKAHQQPITCLDCEGGRVLTGSQDHTLKVFRVEDHHPLYTLHGHYGPITCLFIDKFSPMTSGSGSQDGMLCVWDLLTGTCMYSIQAHDGPIISVTYSASYIISVGGDDKICVWERFQGHLLNTIQLDHAYCSNLIMLTQNLLITSKQGSLMVWDVRNGHPVRAVRLGHPDDKAVFVHQIISCADAVLCDYGSQLRLVRFPSVISKYD